MNEIKYFTFALILATGFWGCDSYVNNVESPSDQIDSERLNNENQVDFLVAGIEQRFATTYDQTILLADALSDALVFDFEAPGATSFSLEQIDSGNIQFDNSDLAAQFLSLGELRFLADDLLRRVNEIEFTDPELKRKALYTGNLYAGIARYLYATYTGLNPTEGGGVIDNGPFIPSEELYILAIDNLRSAHANAATAYERRVINSLMARISLFAGNEVNASIFARDGMQQGDLPFQALYSSQSTNFYWLEGGPGRSQFVVDERFIDYITADSLESARIPIERITEEGEEPAFWIQIQYPDLDSPINFMSWQENELMLAELEFNVGNISSALSRVNSIRQSFGLDDIATLDLDVLLAERDKTLFAQGLRLVDQRRYDRFHLDAGAWQFLPFTEEERNNNPNLQEEGE